MSTSRRPPQFEILLSNEIRSPLGQTTDKSKSFLLNQIKLTCTSPVAAPSRPRRSAKTSSCSASSTSVPITSTLSKSGAEGKSVGTGSSSSGISSRIESSISGSSSSNFGPGGDAGIEELGVAESTCTLRSNCFRGRLRSLSISGAGSDAIDGSKALLASPRIIR